MNTELQDVWESYDDAVKEYAKARIDLVRAMHTTLQTVGETAIDIYRENRWGHPFPGVLLYQPAGVEIQITVVSTSCKLFLDEEDPGLFMLFFEMDSPDYISLSIQHKHAYRYTHGDPEWDMREFAQELSTRTGYSFACAVQLIMLDIPAEAQSFNVQPQQTEGASSLDA